MGFLSLLGGIVVLVWLLGFIFRVGGSFVHILLIVAAIVFIFDWLFGRRRNIK